MAVASLKRWERILYLVILILAVVTRFYMLGDRAISHDESIHTKFSWNFYAGDGFQHNPMMHGPLLFEATALVYHLFGVNDFTSRLFTSLAGVALVMTPLLFRRWLSRPGAALASVMLLISPSISYYSRYIRHDVLLMLSAVLLLWTILKFLETPRDEGGERWLLWLAAAFSVMYATKEASYIYTAIFGVLLFVPFTLQVIATPWQHRQLFRLFLGAMALALLMALLFGLSFTSAQMREMDLDEAGNSRVASVSIPVWGRLAAALGFAALFVGLVLVYYGIGEAAMHRIKLFDVLMVMGTLTLPLGSAFLIKFIAGVDMELVYEAVRSGSFSTIPNSTVVALFGVTLATLLLSVALGLWWRRDLWPKIALIHYAIFFVLYTSIFTWGFGALSGLVGGLAYWLAQQGVKRGNQPQYYYLLIAPIYEYLALVLSAAGGVAAIGVARGGRLWRRRGEQDAMAEPVTPSWDWQRIFPLFLVGWTLASWVAYTYAGEKMPWLLVHIALPSIFLAGWGGGRLVASIDWSKILTRPGWLFLIALPLAVAALVVFAGGLGDLRGALTGGVSPAGPSLAQLRPLGRTLGGLVGLIGAGYLLIRVMGQVGSAWCLRISGAFIALVMVGLTVRTMALLNYVNYDMATEFMVYAHGTPDIKTALSQVQDVSWHATGTAYDVKVAYGEDGSWPFTWYMVDYPNNYFYSTSPDATQLLACPVIIAGSPQYGVVDEIVGADYVTFEYQYLWWPIQDYFDLTWERVRSALADPGMRAALWDIVWRRDYTQYAEVKNPDSPFTLETWPYRKDFRLYVRREIAAQTWPYDRVAGVARYVEPVATEVPDPYVAGAQSLPLASEVVVPGAVLRGMDRAADGTFFIADTANHRIVQVDETGLIGAFGEFGAAPGQFSEPWDVALDADGNIYVADTWNHRIQKFDADFQHLTSWGIWGQTTRLGDPAGQGLFYGPRSLVVNGDEIYVADTGNKRVQVFSLEGVFLREFGGAGRGPGQLDEPVGVAVSAEGRVAVADTWNLRVQLFDQQGVPLRQWQVPTWDVNSPDEKPFVTWDGEQLYVTNPLRRRVLAFDERGAFRWALSAQAGAGLGFPQAVLVADGVLYVTDAQSGRLLGYTLP